MAVDRLILIRHGQTHANVAKLLDTALPGSPLTDEGVAQARRLGRVLLPSIDSLHDVVTSHALRARQTGVCAVAGLHNLAGPGVRIRHESGLHEIAAGDLEGRNDMDAHRIYSETFYNWAKGHTDLRLPGGETGDEILDRYLTQLRHLMAERPDEPEKSTLAVVSHGAVIRLVAGHLTGSDAEYVLMNRLPNTARVVLEKVDPTDPAFAGLTGAEPFGDFTGPGSWRVVEWGTTDGQIPVIGLG